MMDADCFDSWLAIYCQIKLGQSNDRSGVSEDPHTYNHVFITTSMDFDGTSCILCHYEFYIYTHFES